MPDPPRHDRKPLLLVVEDDEALRRVIRRAFADGYEVLEAGDGAQALDVALRLRPEIVITDQRMPHMTGVELLSRVKAELPNTIRVLVTGHTDYGPLVDALNVADVHHYIEKPFHTVDLRTVVEVLHRSSELERQRDDLVHKLQASLQQLDGVHAQLQAKDSDVDSLVDARTRELLQSNEVLREANRKLRDLAVRDGLTDLFNHRCLLEHVELEVARSRRYERHFSMLFIDLDDFKKVNDRHGHATGDRALVRVAELLKPTQDGLRHSDFAARYGGEEFCLVLPETPLEGGAIKAERIRRAVAALDWRDVPGLERLTVSIGVAAYPEHGRSAAEVLCAADAAAYRAKADGKDRVCLATAAAVAGTVG